MATNAAVSVGLEWPHNVIDFARNCGVEAALPSVLEMTWKVFPGAREIDARIEADAELPDLRSIVMEVNVGDMAVADATRAHTEWSRRIFDCFSPPFEIPVILSLTWGAE